jgi:hypothetical protein
MSGKLRKVYVVSISGYSEKEGKFLSNFMTQWWKIGISNLIRKNKAVFLIAFFLYEKV